MSDISTEYKIELMLKIYRERLESASRQPIDFIGGLRAQAQIDILELLYIHAVKNGYKPAIESETK